MVGLEVTPFDWGHYNAYPVVASAGTERRRVRLGRRRRRDADVGPDDRRGEGLVAGRGGADESPARTALGVAHADAGGHADARHSLAGGGLPDGASPDATDTNSALFTTKFDALEIMNGSSVDKAHRVMNDWFTFLSRGWVRTGTATSDTHYALKTQGGYPRTFVNMDGKDLPSEFDSKQFAQGVKAHHAFGTNGPFMKVTARKLPSGAAVQMGDTLSITGDQVEITRRHPVPGLHVLRHAGDLHPRLRPRVVRRLREQRLAARAHRREPRAAHRHHARSSRWW